MRTLTLALVLVLAMAMGAYAQEAPDAPAAEEGGLRITVAQDVTVPHGAERWTNFDTSDISVTVDLALSPQLYASYGFTHSWLTKAQVHDVSATLDWGDGLTTSVGVRRIGGEIQYYGRAQIVFGKL